MLLDRPCFVSFAHALVCVLALSPASGLAAEELLDEQYAAWVSTIPPAQQAWERVLQENLGGFYLPIHKRQKVAGTSNAWDFVEDDPQLPRVLLIGDSVSRGYTLSARKAMEGKANVHRAPANCGPTAMGLQKLDVWLGDGEWDVIHFNFGIHDRNTPVAEYRQRLEQLVERMRQTSATLVWASTTPIPDDPAKKHTAASIIERNEAAAAIMRKHGIATDDLFTAVTPRLEEMQNPNDVHFNAAGYEFLGRCVAEAIDKVVVSTEVRLAGIFADHIVLQRDRPIEVWGWAGSGEDVAVEFADRSAKTTADDTGAWSVTLQPLAASSQGRELRVQGASQTVVVQDVVVGEVWHASGQSNMAMNVSAMTGELESVKSDIAAADLPAIRFCRIHEAESARPLDDLRTLASWTPCSPTTVAHFSGVALYFARQLHTELNVPVGIIDTSRGGTPIEPYIPREAFGSHPTLRRELELGDQGDLEGIWKLPGGVQARDANWLPGRLFHSRLAPIARFAVRGAIWYQGESNCGHREDPRDYQHKMRALVNGWRHALGNEQMPVYFVQLPGSGAGEGWPYLREQQRLAADLPDTGMVVTVDLDGEGIHPSNKVDVGRRLALWALAKDYDKPTAFSGPMFERQEVQGDTIVVYFRHADSGLMGAAKDGLSAVREAPGVELTHWELADETGAWSPAVAMIDGETVVVTSDQSRAPVAVRYAYRVTPEDCNLYNRDGLPASPFCSVSEYLQYDPGLPE